MTNHKFCFMFDPIESQSGIRLNPPMSDQFSHSNPLHNYQTIPKLFVNVFIKILAHTIIYILYLSLPSHSQKPIHIV